jgi:hypothetical protein
VRAAGIPKQWLEQLAWREQIDEAIAAQESSMEALSA